MVLGDTTDDTRPLLRNYFAQAGLLLCNENPYLPSLPTVGGTWNDIVAMMETREVFYSKLYKGRVTYLSRALYYHLKPFRQREANLSPEAAALLFLLRQTGPVGTEELKRLSPLPGKALNRCLDELLKELLITAVQRDKTLNETWCTFLWADYTVWEGAAPSLPSDPAQARRLLEGLLSPRQITKLLS